MTPGGISSTRRRPRSISPWRRKYLTGDLARYRVLIWSEPRLVVTGELCPATSEEDLAVQLALAEKDLPASDARYMLLDQRSGKPRKTRYKLLLRDVPEVR